MRSVKQMLEGKPEALVAVKPEAPVLEALQLMADNGVGSVLVMRGHDLVGIVTERDYARKVVLQGRTSAATPVSDVMTSPVLSVRSDQRAGECMQLMNDRRIRHLPVVDEGTVMGVISIGDLLKAVIDEQRTEIAQLQSYIAS